MGGPLGSRTLVTAGAREAAVQAFITIPSSPVLRPFSVPMPAPRSTLLCLRHRLQCLGGCTFVSSAFLCPRAVCRDGNPASTLISPALPFAAPPPAAAQQGRGRGGAGSGYRGCPTPSIPGLGPPPTLCSRGSPEPSPGGRPIPPAPRPPWLPGLFPPATYTAHRPSCVCRDALHACPRPDCIPTREKHSPSAPHAKHALHVSGGSAPALE